MRKDEMTHTTASPVLRVNLERVFNERDADRRRQAIQELYAPDAVFYEEQEKYSGTVAIEGAITRLLGSLPPTLVFSPSAPAMQNHDMSKLIWKGQLPDGTTVATGTDVALIEDGRIHSIYVFLDPPG
jgi:hypothetical protein